MSSTTLERAGRTMGDLAEAARAHLEEAEEHAARAAESAARAAEHYGARASLAAQQVAHDAAESFDEKVAPQLAQLRDDAEELWDDPDQRRLVLQAAGGVGLVALAVWLWRRRRARKAGEHESSATELAGWQTPAEAFETTG